MSDSNKDINAELLEAVKKGEFDKVKSLISEGADVDARAFMNVTPLHLAAQYNEKKEIVEMLLNKGAKVDIADNRGRTPLHLAAQNNNKEIVDALIKAKANVDIKDEDEKTPLDLTTNEEIKALFKKAAEKPDDVNPVDESSTDNEGDPEEDAGTREKEK